MPPHHENELPSVPTELEGAQVWWGEHVTDQLPVLVERLLASESYGLSDGRNPPPRLHGVYLFTSTKGREYVGRTGWTERSKRAGKPGSSHFLQRLKGHLTPRHNAGTFAYRRAHKATGHPPGSRAENCANPEFMVQLRTAIDEVRAMEFRVVRIDDDRLASVFEVYVATVLHTPWNSFATS